MEKLTIQGLLHGSLRSIREGEKLVDIVISVSTTNQIVACPKGIHNRFKSDEPNEFFKRE
jgi:hypothetical protein